MMLQRALGTYEADKFSAVERLLGPGDVFVDAGANKGDFALFAAPLVGVDGQVVAVEPEPENFNWLEKSVRLNGFTNVSLLQLALSDEAGGFAQLHLSKVSGWHSLTPRGSGGDTIPVAVQSLDDLIAAEEIPPPTGVKIDVEGWELRVLQGGEELFRTAEDLSVFIDLHPQLGVDPREIAEFLRDRGFRLAPPGDLEAELEVGCRTLELVGLKGQEIEGRLSRSPTR